jgi:hypothetical protein
MPEISLRSLIVLVLAILRDFVRVWFGLTFSSSRRTCSFGDSSPSTRNGRLDVAGPPGGQIRSDCFKPILPVAAGVVDRKTRNVCPLAPRGFSIVLAVEVEARGSTSNSSPFACACGDDGGGESEPGISMSSGGAAVIRKRLADRFEDFSCDVGLQRAQGRAFCFPLVCLLRDELLGATSVRT